MDVSIEYASLGSHDVQGDSREELEQNARDHLAEIMDDLGLEADSVTIEMYRARHHFLPEDAKFRALAVFNTEGLRPKA